MRLIDADALLKKADWFEYYDEDGHWDGFERIDVDDVEKAPTIDAVEVVHGRWEKSKDDYFEIHVIKCSLCHEEWCFDEPGDVVAMYYKHCPNCGAKMDGDNHEEISL